MHQPTARPVCREPDQGHCRTCRITATWLRHEPLISHCLNEQEDCKYGMPFAYGFLCKHPHHLAFAGTDDEQR